MDLRLIGSLDHGFPLLRGKLVEDPLADAGMSGPFELRGSAAALRESSPGHYRLLRDPLGINKLFWALREDAIVFASRPHRLVAEGFPLSSIHAIAPGSLVDLDLPQARSRRERLVPDPFAQGSEPHADVEAIATRIAALLDDYCSALAAVHRDRPVFVCTSGGLDSTGVAVQVREHFPRFTAISFDLERASGAASEDRETARRLAADLGVPLLEVTVTEDELLEPLDLVLREGIDWRDFNVHAALVNAAMARAVAEQIGDAARTGLVFTGDLMNEFLVDYHEETYRGRVYYRLPRLGPRSLRRVLVKGVETSHREVGIFEAWNLPVVQLYSVAADLYCSLPPEFLAVPGNKERLSRLVFGDRIPEYVYRRRKTRAQIGDPETGKGVLALCVDRGIDQSYLRARFAALHEVRNPVELDRFLNAGRYRSALPFDDDRR